MGEFAYFCGVDSFLLKTTVMVIEFSEKQYRTLLKAIYWAEWLKNNDKMEEEFDEEGQDISDLEQYIYSHARDFGCNDWIDPQTVEGEFLPTAELEDITMEAILEYEDYVFWSELAERLAARDLEEMPQNGRSPLMEFVEADELADKYMAEFEINGLKNLRLTIEEE
jgi:hypothetical protein